MVTPPKKILLATDLSSRSDRAQDRAVLLMKQFDAELLVLHVLEPTEKNRTAHCGRFWAFNPDQRARDEARFKVKQYLGDIGNKVIVRVEKGAPHRIILSVAVRENCDLIITGIARSEALGRIVLGKSVKYLLRKSDIPILIVTDRVLNPYRNIIVLSDFSSASRKSLEVAATYFPDQKLKILHASTMMGIWAADDIENHKKLMQQMAYEEYIKFLDMVHLPSKMRGGADLLIEWGSPPHILEKKAQCQSIDLVVVGSRVGGFFKEAFKSSMSNRIVSALLSDVLVVRETSYRD
jgi:nucleotide-binding universal stress UspA family protein